MYKIIKIKEDVLKICLKGELDHHMASKIKDEIDFNISKHKVKNILFDFADISFMDSSGVGMVIGRYKLIDKIGGKIGIINLNDKVKRIFDMSGLFNIIEFFNSEKEAIEKL